jgi:hypothetical protein
MALGSTQPLTEMSTRNLRGGGGGGGRLARKADSLPAICEPIVQETWEPRRLTTLWASTGRYSVTSREHHTYSCVLVLGVVSPKSLFLFHITTFSFTVRALIDDFPPNAKSLFLVDIS